MATAQAWQWLVQQAILGVERSKFQVMALAALAPPEHAELQTLLTSVDGAESSAQFLHAAAIIQQLRQVGQIPRTLPTTLAIPRCPPASGRPAPARAVSLLLQFLLENHVRLVNEWLAAATVAGCDAPHPALPELLTLATARREVAERLAPCLGERGRWLLALNPAWQVADAVQLTAVDWHTGAAPARTAYLRTLRQHSPEQARQLLAASWQQEAAKDRLLLLATFDVGLQPADAPFLERCLSDRSEQVSRQAAQLLARLDGSSFQTALYAVVSQVLQMERRWLRRTLQVDLPESLPPAWRSLTIKEQTPAGEMIGAKAWWLVQLLSLTRPSGVAQLLQLAPADLLGLAREHDFGAVLIRGLVAGAETHADHDFLVEYLLQLPLADFPAVFAEQAGWLPTAQRDSALAYFLTSYQSQQTSDWEWITLLLQPCEHLSAPLSERLLRRHLGPLLALGGENYHARQAVSEATYRLAPAAYPLAEALVRELGDQAPEWVNNFLQIYHLRFQIEQTFQLP